MAANPQHPMTVDEYLELDRNSLDAKYEYIDGIIYDRYNPQALAGGSAAHSWLSINILILLQKHLRQSPWRVFNSDMRVRVSATRFTYPDISVSCTPADLHEEQDTIAFPRLLIEVLSPSTEAYDRGKKFAYYQQIQSLQEYVLISSQRQSVEVFTRDAHSWRYMAFTEPEQHITLTSVGLSFTLSELYADVNLPQDDGPPAL